MLWPTPGKVREAPSYVPGERVYGLLRKVVPLLLRGSLGVTFLWFGGLKLAGEPTLPASLIAAITPFVDPDLSVPLVGAFEVQLSGTFLVLLLRPDVAFVEGNPLLLSVEGEYVVKNLVLLAAIASLALHSSGTPPTKRLRLAEGRGLDRETPTEDAA